MQASDIIRGYQIEKGVYITVEDEELEALQVESSHTIEIDKFVPLSQIDPRFYDSPYYVVPNDKVGLEAFAVIRDAMKGKGMVGLGRVVVSRRERPIILEPLGKGIRATTLRYAYEVRKEDDYFDEIPDVKIGGETQKLAEHILDSKAADFKPSEFVDSYEVAVVALLKDKQAGHVPKKTPSRTAPPPNGNIIDILKKSLEMSKKTVTIAPPLQPAQPKGKAKTRARA